MAVGRAKRGASILEAGVAAEGTAVRAVGTAVGYLATAGCWARTAVVGEVVGEAGDAALGAR